MLARNSTPAKRVGLAAPTLLRSTHTTRAGIIWRRLARGSPLALTAGSTVYLARYYQSGSLTPFPWDFSFPKGPEVPYWAPWTNLVWATFIALLCLRARSWLWPGSISPAVSASPSSQDKPASPALLQAEAVES